MIQLRLEAEVVSKVSDLKGRVLQWGSASTRAAFVNALRIDFAPLVAWITRYARAMAEEREDTVGEEERNET